MRPRCRSRWDPTPTPCFARPLVSSSDTEHEARPVEVTMPETGIAEPARIIAWHVRPGGTVAEGDPICTVDLGTAHGVVSSPASGRLRNAFVGVRATVDAGATLALIEVAPAVPAILSEPAPEPEPEPDPAEPEPVPESAANVAEAHESNEGADANRDTSSSRIARPTRSSADVVAPPAPVSLQRFHSPAVRRLASDLGVDLAEVRGTGRDGRVSRQDVVAAAGHAQVRT